MTDEERAALGESFNRILDGGLRDHLIEVEKDLFNQLLKARSPRRTRQIKAEIKAVRHAGQFIMQTISEGKIDRENLLIKKQVETGERSLWH